MLCPYNMNVVLRFLGFVGGGNSGSSENSFSGKWKSSDEIPSDKTSSNGLRCESAKKKKLFTLNKQTIIIFYVFANPELSYALLI